MCWLWNTHIDIIEMMDKSMDRMHKVALDPRKNY